MEIKVMNRERIEGLARRAFTKKTAVISITDSDAPPVFFRHAPEFLLRLRFDDLEPDSDLLRDLMAVFPEVTLQYQIITDEQAAEIAGFVQMIDGAADQLICQCEHGQSRSAAVAAAILEYNGSNINLFADQRYAPNRNVYEKVRTALQKSQTVRRN